MSTSLFTEPPRRRSVGVAPRPRSIFTLRPSTRTQQPPSCGRQGMRPARRRTAWTLLGGAVIFGGLLAAWAFAPHGASPTLAPVVYFSGAPKIKETPDGKPERWAHNTTITVFVDQSVDQIGPGARDAVMNSFGTWLGSGASLPNLTFDSASGTKAKLQRDGKNTILYAPIEIPKHEKDLAITIGFVEPGSGRLLEADIILNAKEPFGVLPTGGGEVPDDSSSCGGRYDLQDVVTHESGHFFGLGEDMDDQHATMFYKTGMCELRKRDLTPPDSAAMNGLYSGADDETGLSQDPARAGCSAAPDRPKLPGWFTAAVLCAIGMVRVTRRRYTAGRGPSALSGSAPPG